ncbi:MAG TPA: HAMP domain-containing sensor histidine kinase [Terriglobia bacterium]|nr:HAMP domain-containing sensor histidine kinase [Terriglobia bacterium]
MNLPVPPATGSARLSSSPPAARPLCRRYDLCGDCLHTLSQPLTAAWGSLELLLAQPQHSSEALWERLQEALEELRALTEWIRVLGDVAEEQRVSPPAAVVALNETLPAAFEVLRRSLEGWQLRLETVSGETVRVAISPELVTRALFFLLHDAFGDAAGTPAAVISLRRSEDAAEIVVAGESPALAAEPEEVLFNPFYGRRRVARRGRRGGFGLAVAKRIIESHHGLIRAQFLESNRLCFHIRLPLAPGNGSLPPGASQPPACFLPAPASGEDGSPKTLRKI